MSNISYIILSLESALSFLFGIILYVFPDLLLSYFLKNTDGVHWHMARVAGSVLLGESYTFWHWSKSTTASPVGAASFSRIITIAFGIAAFWNDAVGDNFLIQNTRMLSIVPIFWLTIHIITFFYHGFPLGRMMHQPIKEVVFNFLLHGDSLASLLIGGAWIAFPNLILKKQVKFTLDNSHFLLSRFFGALLFSTHIFSAHSIYFENTPDRQNWGIGRAIINLAVLIGQIYSQFAYGDWWTRGHWVGISLFSIWCIAVLLAVTAHKPNKDE